MASFRDRIPIVLLFLVLLVNAVALRPELTISRVDLNDNVFHYTLVERIVAAVQHGQNPLDCWSAEWSFGYPVLRIYQPLAHLMVAGIWFALGKTIPLMTVFVWVRFLSLALLPLSFFAAARLLGLSRPTAAAAAMLAPLISTNFLFGIEYGSFTWAGSGLFPQAVATHFLLLAIGFGYGAIRHGRRPVIAGVLVGLTLLAHLIYGYIAALTLVLLAVVPAEVPRGARLLRTAGIGVVAFLISAFQVLPLLADRSLINHSVWEPVWKWDSFGPVAVIKWLFTGELLDHGRLPVLTLLAFAGAALLWWNTRKRRETPEAHAFLAVAAAFWILLYCGRPLWGPLLNLLGVSEDMHLHRVIAGAQVFLVLLAAVALDALWQELAGRRQAWVAAAATVLLLYPMVKERSQNLANDALWGRNNLNAYAAEKQAIDAAVNLAKANGGRAYAGLAATWGAKFRVGEVPFYAFFSEPRVPALSFLYHSMALTGDMMVRFNDWSPPQYRLFNVRTVVAPDGLSNMPPMVWTPRAHFGRFQVFDAPGGGYFDVVDASLAIKTNRRNFYAVNDRWLQSDWPARRTHLLLDWHGSVGEDAPHWDPDAGLPAIPSNPAGPGSVAAEKQANEVYEADLDMLRPAYALFKMTWHPNWKAYVDGAPRPVTMLSPGFSGVSVPAGRHHIVFRYQPGPAKEILALFGIIAVLLAGNWRGRVLPALSGLARRRPVIPKPVTTAAGLLLLSLPVCLRLFTGSLLGGHDAFCYFPRIVEIHQNLIHGVLVPTWAPDLGHGYGQPLFVFHPPFFYWVAELWHIAGADYVTAVNLACALLVLISAAGMFRLGRLYFAETGGWLAAAAYLYVPYFAVDLYVRSALEEFSAFALFPLALYGFGAFARDRQRRHWILGVLAFAGVLFCHFPAALLFTPLLVTFLALVAWLEKQWRVVWALGAGLAIGLGLGAITWLPALAEKQYVSIERVLHGYSQYAIHFVYLHQLFYSPWGYGLSVEGPNDGMSFALGWTHLILAVGAWFWIRRHAQVGERRLIRFFAAAGLLLCILMLEDAIWFWGHLPLLQYVELPWRLLQPVAVCTAMLVAALGPAIASLQRWRGAAMAGALALLIVPNLSHLEPGKTMEVDLAYWTPRQLSARGFDTTTMGEITPRWMQSIPPYDPTAARVAAGQAQVRDLRRTPFRYAGEVTAATESRVRMSLAWFPGWSVRVDGRAADAGPAPVNGLVEFTVPPGKHEVQVTWEPSPARRVGTGISLAALAALALLAYAGRWFSGPAGAPKEAAVYSTQSS
jgi:uncharacterized membrane protein